MKKFTITGLIAGLALLFCSSVYAFHNWNGYHWARTANPFPLPVINSTTQEWSASLAGTLSAWESNNSPIRFAAAYADDSRKARKRCQHVEGMMRVCNADYGYNGWLGLASIYLDSNGHITKGTAKMNDSYSSYWDEAEMNHVMCQEIGHVLGLGHTSENGDVDGTCMDYSTDPSSQWPNAHDYDELISLYAHPDSYDSFASLNTGGGNGDSGGGSGCNSPPGKGCNKSSVGADIPPMGFIVDRGKQFEIRVAPGLDGGLWIHHVYLVNPHQDEH